MLLVWLLSPVARASPVVIVPPRADAIVGSDVVERAVGELMRVIRAQGLDPISPGQSGASAEEARDSGSFPKGMNPNECYSIECAMEFRTLFDASFAVQLLLFAEGPGSVSVVITETPTAYFTGNAEIEGGDIQAAVRVAYLAARDKHMHGAGPWLSVVGTPAGAAVYVDGVRFGKLPVDRRRIEPGAHRVEVRQHGLLPRKYSVEIPKDVNHDERLQVALDFARIDRTWDYVAGGALAAAGAVHLALGAYQMSKVGDCAQTSDGQCVEEYGDHQGVRQEPLLIGLGAAGVAAGGLIMWLAPIGHLRLRAGAGRESAWLGASGVF